MNNVAVQIVRFVDDSFPGFVECELVDASGRCHILKDKVPIFTDEVLDADSTYPVPGLVACEVVGRYQDDKGQELLRVSTASPLYIESAEGVSEFTVLANVVSSTPDKKNL